MRFQSGSWRAVACLLLLGSVGAAGAQEGKPGAAKSELRVGRESFTLRSSYALAVDDAEGLRVPGKPAKQIILLFTDRTVPADLTGSFFRCMALARKGLLNGVEIDFDAASGRMIGAAIYHGVGADRPAGLNITVSGSSSTYTFSDLKLGPEMVSGRAMMANAEEWPGVEKEGKPLTFQYDIAFRTKLAHEPAVTADLKGAAARTSAPTLAMLAFEKACRKGDLEAAKRLATPLLTGEWEGLIQQSGLETFKKEMRSSTPETEARRKQITRVVVRGNKATVLFKEGEGQSWQTLSKVGGAWLVDAP